MAQNYSSEDFNISPDVVERLTNPAGQAPFADEFSGAPYIDEFRKLSLNKLLHLAPYSGVLIVSGAAGAGKTTLLRQFIKRAGDTWRVVLISASPSIDSRQFLQQIAQGFELNIEAHTSLDDVLWEIGRYLQSLGRSGRRAIIVIDDAQLLLTDVFQLLEKIVGNEQAEDAVGAVLSVDDEKAIDLDELPMIQEKLAYTLRFEPLSETGTLAYIQHHLALTGQADAAELFTAEAVSRLYQKSGGWPGELNALARQLLDKANARKSGVVIAGSNILRWGIVAAAVLAIAAVLVFQDDINQLVDTPVEEEMAARGDIQRADEAPKKKLLADLTPKIEAPIEASPEQPVPAPAIDMPPSLPGPQTDESVVQLGKISSGADEIMPEPMPLPATLPPVVPVKQAPKPVAKLKPVPKPAPKPVVAKVIKKTPPPAPEKIWLMAQAQTNFTMQLMALEDEAKLKAFVKRHQIQNRSSVFKITRKGKRLTVLVYGSFASREEVDKAARVLPRAWGVKPWLRSFASIRAELDGG